VVEGAGEGLETAERPLLGTDRLRDLASANVPVVGAAVRYEPAVADPAYAAMLARHYNQVTPEHHFKWEMLRPAPGVFQFGPADALVAQAEASGQSVRGHTLVWDTNLPAWMSDALGPAGVEAAMREHVRTVVSRYRGRVAHWDVVNEALSSSGGYRDTVFFRAMGPAYLAEAFREAHTADPAARLAYNDFGLERPGPKQDAAFAMLRDLRAAGVPVHEVGLQLHLYPEQWVDGYLTAAMLRSTIARFGSLGLDVYVTELDARLDRLAGPLPVKLELQGELYHSVAAACHAEPACRGVTTWGFTDAHTYLAVEAYPLPFDAALAPKAAAHGLAAGLRGVPAPSQVGAKACATIAGLLRCEPFESARFHGLGRVQEAGGVISPLSTGVFRGLLSGQARTPTASAVRRAFLTADVTTASTTLWARTMLFIPSGTNDLSVFSLDEKASPWFGVGLVVDASGRAVLRVGGTKPTRVVGPTFPRNRWVCAELRVRVSDSSGEADLFLDGARAARVTRVDTKFASAYGTAKVGLIWTPANGAPAEVRFDELAVSTSRPGCP
jgi:endo-1,4-beta-xylanase